MFRRILQSLGILPRPLPKQHAEHCFRIHDGECAPLPVSDLVPTTEPAEVAAEYEEKIQEPALPVLINVPSLSYVELKRQVDDAVSDLPVPVVFDPAEATSPPQTIDTAIIKPIQKAEKKVAANKTAGKTNAKRGTSKATTKPAPRKRTPKKK